MTKRNAMVFAAVFVALGLTMAAGATVVKAELIDIQISNFPLRYGSNNLFDAASVLGGTADVSKASPVGPVTISVDGSIQYTYSYGDLFGDLLIQGISGLSATNFSQVNPTGPSNAFGLDLLKPSGETFLGLNFNNADLSVIYYATPLGQPVFVLSGGAAVVEELNLPGSLALGPNDQVTFTLTGTQITNVGKSGGFVTSFDAQTTGTISANVVPEPSMWALLLAGLAAVGLAGRVRAWRS